jgi:hypothetical protein
MPSYLGIRLVLGQYAIVHEFLDGAKQHEP